ncbi:MAG: ArnT family glycosyltransferase [Lachnotalea sp.]
MNLKKNLFYHLSMAIATIGLLYILVCGFMSLGEGQEYPYLPKGLLLISILAIWMIVSVITAIIAKIELAKSTYISSKFLKYAEIAFVILILAAAAAIRVIVIAKLPMQPASDYKTYYEIAQLLKAGTIQKAGKGYCNYIAMFPHVMGYCYILKTMFKIVGTSVTAGQYLNVFFSTATVFFTYKIGRKLGGKTAGIISLILSAFWPSQVLYINMLSAESSFTFFLFLSIWVFVSLVKDYEGNTKSAGKGIAMHLLLGVLIALTAAIRPMAMILLIAIIITLLPQKMKLSLNHRNNIPLTLRILEKGWIRCILIILPYMIISNVITTNIEITVNKTLPSASTSFGYNLLVGLNTQSIGGWNEEDSQLLYSSMEETGSASQAHITCRDLAFQRIINNPKGIINLFIQKYELLWGNDDYGATWNLAFLDEQGNLTQERSDFLYTIRDVNNIIYMIVVFLGLISLLYLWKEKGNFVYVLVLLYLGTVVMHLLVESQNRYHYFILEVFMIMGGMGIQFMYNDAKKSVLHRGKQKDLELLEKEIQEQIVEAYDKQEIKIEELRKEAYSNVFDMQAAIQSGNVIMTVSQAYQEEQCNVGNIVGNIEAAATEQIEENLEEKEVEEEQVEEEQVEEEQVEENKVEEKLLEGKQTQEKQTRANEADVHKEIVGETLEQINDNIDKYIAHIMNNDYKIKNDVEVNYNVEIKNDIQIEKTKK